MSRFNLNLPEDVAALLNADEMASIAREAYRPSSNETEEEIRLGLQDRGALVLRRGWPDFLVVWPSGGVEVIEVKAPGDIVRPTQRAMLAILNRAFPASVRQKNYDGSWMVTTIGCECCGGRGVVPAQDAYDTEV